jgi:hypothetical protein
MSIKISIPLDLSQISVSQFVSYYGSRNETEKVMAISGKSRKIVESFQYSTIQEIIDSFEEAMKRGAPKHEQTFVIEGMRLGFIPDLNAMALKEHIDLDLYANEIWKKDEVNYSLLPKLLAILFRPVKGKVGSYYEIQDYDSDLSKLHMDRIGMITMDRVNGALVFFSTIANECALNGAEYLVEEMKKEMMMDLSHSHQD